MKSKPGYLLSGSHSGILPTNESFNTLHTSVREFEHCDISKFWDLESTGTLQTNKPSSENELLVSYLKSSVSRQSDESCKMKFHGK